MERFRMSETQVEATTKTGEQESASTDWQAMARKHEKAAKDLRAQLRDAQPQLEELTKLKHASQTETERWQNFGQEQEKRAATAEADAMRYRVALAKGLPASLAERLRGADQAALEADADELLALIPAPQQDNSPRTPLPDRSQGSSGNGAPPSDPAQQFAGLIRKATGR